MAPLPLRSRWLLAACAGLLAAGAIAIVHGMRGASSSLVDRPAPAFVLAQLADPQRTFRTEEMLGQVWILNIWASWCTPCRDEHPVLLELARSGAVPLVGINYRDRPMDAGAWLKQLGDPFRLSLADASGAIDADLQIRGIPRTWVIDRRGVIRYDRSGPITRAVLQQELLPIVRKLKE